MDLEKEDLASGRHPIGISHPLAPEPAVNRAWESIFLK
jgi:hypothetical protein